ncbi:putative DEAD box family helicase [Salmonella phage 41]|nr:putative DEAD box family helicase [Salmonella phage 41]
MVSVADVVNCPECKLHEGELCLTRNFAEQYVKEAFAYV